MTLEELGAILGFVAFVGLAVLIFLTFQQARQLRRLRDWAGRAPERAAAVAARAGEETLPAADYEEEEVEVDTAPSRTERFREAFGARWSDLDRRMPVDPKIILGGLVAIIAGIVIAVGFGGGDTGTDEAGEVSAGSEANNNNSGATEPKPTKVAVLNGTSPPVAGLADSLSDEVEGAGFRVGVVENAPAPVSASVLMFRGNAEDDAAEVAAELAPVLGPTEVIAMTPDVEAVVGGTKVALVIGADDAGA
ncbi:MAG: LytR C-terminal domain-containing protein [Solirubrobacterales bacterium]